MTEIRALFIPLVGWAFDLFEAGTKRHEYRRYGARWNERTCLAGRPVILSRGYGRLARLEGYVVSFTVLDAPPDIEAWERAFGPFKPGAERVAMIEIHIP